MISQFTTSLNYNLFKKNRAQYIYMFYGYQKLAINNLKKT